MRIYIVEDDTSVIGILEDIVEGNELGVVCGDSGGEPANLGQILALDPDLVLVDLLMPQKDGIQVVRELKEQGCRAKFIMISQVSNKEMVAKAYLAGVDFFINKPINLIEVRQVILNVRRQLENERDLHTIQSVFAEKAAPVGRRSRLEAQRKRIQTTLSQLGMAGEKGARDIVELCMLLLEQGQQVSQVGVGALCAQLSDSPKSMEQRARRAVERGLHHLASLGLEDYGNEIFTLYHDPIAQGGSNLSGGQRQRMAIARALIKRPEIYVFDDSFSALDMKTDQTLRQNLKESMGEAAIILVAQRVSTILDADRILVVDDGRIVGQGTHGELLRTCPLYREIAEIQLGKEAV